jgi:hypothetical protein
MRRSRSARPAEPRRGAIRRDVEGDVAVEDLDLHLRLRTLEVRELRGARLLDALPALLEVDLALVTGNLELLRGRLGLHVLPEVVVHAGAFDDDRLDRLDLGAPADRPHRISMNCCSGGLGVQPLRTTKW